MKHGKLFTLSLVALAPAALALVAILAATPIGISEETERELQPGDIIALRFQHIFVHLPETATEEERAGKREKIEAAKRLLDSGRDFTEVAREYSESPAEPERRGIMNRVESGRINPILEKTLIEIPDHSYSDIIETDRGYHILHKLWISYVVIPPTPIPTPTPMFERRLSATGISTYAFRPLNNTVPYTIDENAFLWSSQKDAEFYAQVDVPDGAEVVGFCIWMRDSGGEERPYAELLQQVGMAADRPPDRVCFRESDGPWPDGQMAMCHYPGIKHIAQGRYGNSLVARAVLRSGDEKQAIHGGILVYTFGSAEGAKLEQMTIDYIEGTQSRNPGVCPVCLGRERQQRELWLRIMGKDVPNPQKSRLDEQYPHLRGSSGQVYWETESAPAISETQEADE